MPETALDCILGGGGRVGVEKGTVNPLGPDAEDPRGVPEGTQGSTHAHGPPVEGDWWLRSVVRNASGIVTIVPDGTLRYANPAWQRVLGYDLEEAIGTMNFLDHLHPEDLAHVLEETEAASRGRVAFSGGVNPRCGEPRKVVSTPRALPPLPWPPPRLP
jgi:PAS domain-containing protein